MKFWNLLTARCFLSATGELIQDVMNTHGKVITNVEFKEELKEKGRVKEKEEK